MPGALRRRWWAVLAVAALAGPACNCGAYDETLARIEAIAGQDAGASDAGALDAGVDDGGAGGGDDAGLRVDAGQGDAGRGLDGGAADAGLPPADAGEPDDAGVSVDAGRLDAGLLDGGVAVGLDGSVDPDLDGGALSCGKLLQPCPCCSGFSCCVSAAGAETCISLMDVCLP